MLVVGPAELRGALIIAGGRQGSRASSLFEVCGEGSIKGPGGRPEARQMKEGPHCLPASQASTLPLWCSHSQSSLVTDKATGFQEQSRLQLSPAPA